MVLVSGLADWLPASGSAGFSLQHFAPAAAANHFGFPGHAVERVPPELTKRPGAQLSAGTVFMATHGEYSGYQLASAFRVLRDVNLDEELLFFQCVSDSPDYEARAFLSHLVMIGALKESDVPEVYLGCWGEPPSSWEYRE